MADSKREKTKYAGVYQLTSSVRRHDGKSDVCFYYTLKTREGKKLWVKVGWRSEGYSAQVATNARNQAIQTQRDGLPLACDARKLPGTLFGEAWDIWDKKWLTPSIKNPQYERVRYCRYIKDVFGQRRMDAITTLELEELKTALLSRLSPASVRLIMGDIRRVYRKMMEWDLYTGQDPTLRLVMPRVDNARNRYLTPEEAAKLFSVLKRRSRVWHDIALISLHTGMRLSEVLGLQRQDINLPAKSIHVRDGKTGSRATYMTPTVFSALSDLMPSLSTAPDSLLFKSRHGRRIHANDASNTFRKSVIECGFNPPGTDRRNRVSFHTLRHTFCSWLAIHGVPLFTIGNMAGHSSTEMTQRYAHLCPSQAKDAAMSVEAIASRAIHQCVHDAPPDSLAQPDDDTAPLFQL